VTANHGTGHISRYPHLRLSLAELREELDAYLAERAAQRQSTGLPTASTTLELDRQKTQNFLSWLETGELPATGRKNSPSSRI
jgi:hypothetical protein